MAKKKEKTAFPKFDDADLPPAVEPIDEDPIVGYVALTPIGNGGKRYEVGDVAPLDPRLAAKFIAKGIVKPITKSQYEAREAKRVAEINALRDKPKTELESLQSAVAKLSARVQELELTVFKRRAPVVENVAAPESDGEEDLG